MMSNKKYVVLIVVVMLSISCSLVDGFNASRKMIGKEIKFPSKIESFQNGNLIDVSNIDSLTCRMIVYFNSNGCSSCKISFIKLWDYIIKHNKYTHGKFGVTFILSPEQQKIYEVRRAIVANKNNNGVVLLDVDNKFEELNPHIPKNNRYHTFLLDKDNKIVLVGDPLDNEKLWELYKKEISRLCRD